MRVYRAAGVRCDERAQQRQAEAVCGAAGVRGFPARALHRDDVSPGIACRKTIRVRVTVRGCKCRYAMDYTVAVDEHQNLESTLLGPAGVRGIPHAFVVDAAGIVRFSGHPADPQFATVVEQCLLAAAAPAKVRCYFAVGTREAGGRVSSRAPVR